MAGAGVAGAGGGVGARGAASGGGAAGAASGGVRIDSWLWAVRVYKTRSLSTAACRAGHVRVNGERAKAAQTVRPGDEVRARISGFDRILKVSGLAVKRGSATVAAQNFVDLTPPPPPREAVASVPVRDRGAGRPTKRDRREIERLRGVRDDY